MGGRTRGISEWFLDHAVAANLLMCVLLVGGLVAIATMRQEVFPTAVLDTIEVRVEYRGATATEVEAQIVEPMEQSIDTLRDIHTVVSEIRAGSAEIFVMLDSGADVQRTLDEVRSAIGSLSSLPADMEPPTIVQMRDPGGGDIDVGFYGFERREEVHAFAARTRARLLELPSVGQVDVAGAGEPEIEVWVSPERARLFGLSLEDVKQRLGRAAYELSGGGIRSGAGEFGLSTGYERRRAHEFEDVAIVESPSGVPLTLADIARVEEGFSPTGATYRINGNLGVLMTVYGAGGTPPAEISESVRALLGEIAAEMPGRGVIVLDDDARAFSERASILGDSAIIGLVLVLILLFLVLEPRVAFWVAAGLPVAMLGGVALFALTPYTINFVSIFSFIIVIGVVVDDAMVIGESIYSGIQDGLSPHEAGRATLDRFSSAISLAILTNVVAFTPIFFMPGELGLFLVAIPVVTTCVFVASLIEALWILPAHLAHGEGYAVRGGGRSRWVQQAFERFRDVRFVPAVRACIAQRGTTIAVGIGLAALVFAWVASGRVPIAMQPAFENTQVTATFALHPGAAESQVEALASRIERVGREAAARLGDPSDVVGVVASWGVQSGHVGEVEFALSAADSRGFSAQAFAQAWRDGVGHPPQLTQLAFDYTTGPGDGRDLVIELAHADAAVSRQAAETLVRQLGDVPGVGQISFSGNAFRSEVRVVLTATGRALGFDEQEVSGRLRAQLDGLEAVRFSRGTDEVRVMVRGDRKDAATLSNLNDLVLTSGQGRQAALGDIATIQWERGAVEMRRIDGRRIERVEATIDRRVTSKSLVEDLVSERLLPDLEARMPGLRTWDEALDTGEEAATESRLLLATVAVLVTIFVLIGAYTNSIRDSAIILATIPLSAAGALLGHLVLGVDLSAASFLGVLALAGLVINAGLLLQLRYSEALGEGEAPEDAMLRAVRDRFRPILLSSVTTLVGLAPLIFSPSVHAAAMRPVAISVGFGMLFSIPVILLLMPCISVALDVRRSPRTEVADGAPAVG